MPNEQEIIHILGIESSGLTSAIAVSQNSQLLGQVSLNIKNVHSRRMALMMEQVLEHVGLDVRNLSVIALSSGPGSFTGLRIGYSLAKGLSHALKIPIVEIPTLDIWAYQQGKTELPVLAVIDAHRDEIFCAGYLWQHDKLERQGDYRLLPLSSLENLLSEPTLVVGGDAQKLEHPIRKYAGQNAVFPFPFLSEPQGSAFVRLAYLAFLQGDANDAELSEPLYMRAFKGVM